MSEPIKVGDLVYVARGDCNCHLGRIYQVARMQPLPPGWVSCRQCRQHQRFEAATWAIEKDGAHLPIGFPVAWLGKIDPPALEVEREAEEAA